MASTNAKAIRKDEVLLRLSKSLGVEAADLHADAKGDAEMAHIMTLERLADALDAKGDGKAKPVPAADPSRASVEKQLEAETGTDVVGGITVETIQTIPAKENTVGGVPKGKGR